MIKKQSNTLNTYKERLIPFWSLIFLGLQSIALSAETSLPDEHASIDAMGDHAHGHAPIHVMGDHVHGYAPIGVMGDHVHKQGGWMLSYRYSNMFMDGNRDGSSNLSRAEVLQDFMVAPLEMRTEMHMIGTMYGVTDRLTLMGMVPYIRKSMTHVNRMGVRFETISEGLGDIKLTALQTLYNSSKNHHQSHHKVHLNIGLSLPTGSVDEKDDTPAGLNKKLPYPMQLGSGTYDPMLGITYVNRSSSWSWGSQLNTVFRIGENSEGYRKGNEQSATIWIAKNLNKHIGLSLRMEGKHWSDIHGDDDELNPTVVPTARSDLRAGERVDLLIGLNLLQGTGMLANHRLAIEFGMPIYQSLDGPQLKTKRRLTVGWQWAF